MAKILSKRHATKKVSPLIVKNMRKIRIKLTKVPQGLVPSGHKVK